MNSINVNNESNNISIYHRYWVYSPTEFENLQKAHKNMSNKKIKLGKVIVNGIYKNYTSIVKSKKDIKYSDSIIVTQGDIRKIQYYDHEF